MTVVPEHLRRQASSSQGDIPGGIDQEYFIPKISGGRVKPERLAGRVSIIHAHTYEEGCNDECELFSNKDQP